MKFISIAVVVSLVSLTTGALSAAEPADVAIHSEVDSKSWGVELNVMWPFVPEVEIYNGKATWTLWRSSGLRGDLVLGALIRPGTERTGEGEFSEYALNLGYRQFVWRGLHLEAALYPGYARLTDNVIDGRDYEAFAATTEVYAGYRLLFSEVGWVDDNAALDPIVNLQAGAGYALVNTNDWPKTEDNAPFFVGSLLLGAAF